MDKYFILPILRLWATKEDALEELSLVSYKLVLMYKGFRNENRRIDNYVEK